MVVAPLVAVETILDAEPEVFVSVAEMLVEAIVPFVEEAVALVPALAGTSAPGSSVGLVPVGVPAEEPRGPRGPEGLADADAVVVPLRPTGPAGTSRESAAPTAAWSA